MPISQQNFESLLQKYGAEALHRILGLEKSDLRKYESQIKLKLKETQQTPIVIGKEVYDGPTCSSCGGQHMMRAGTCYTCLTCGTPTGCS